MYEVHLQDADNVFPITHKVLNGVSDESSALVIKPTSHPPNFGI